MEPKYLWIMVGLPCSGKSTKVKELFYDRNRQDVDVLSTDAIIQEWCEKNGVSYTEGFPKFIDKATELFFDLFRQSIKNRRSIVIDRTNLTIKSRSRFLSQIPKDYRKIAIIMDCEAGEYLERLEARNKLKEKYISINVVDNMSKTYQYPSKDEGFDEIVHLDTTIKEET